MEFILFSSAVLVLVSLVVVLVNRAREARYAKNVQRSVESMTYFVPNPIPTVDVEKFTCNGCPNVENCNCAWDELSVYGECFKEDIDAA